MAVYKAVTTNMRFQVWRVDDKNTIVQLNHYKEMA